MLGKRTGEVQSTRDTFLFVLLDFEHGFYIADSLERSSFIFLSPFQSI